MMQDVHVKLNPILACQKQHPTWRELFIRKLDLYLRKIPMKYCIWSTAVYGARTQTLRKVDQKYMESFEMWYWRRMEISWNDRVRNEEVLHRVKRGRNIHTMKGRKAYCIGHMLRGNCLLKHATEGKIGGTGGRARRHKQLLNDLKDTRGYWKLKEDAADRTVWRIHFGAGYNMNESIYSVTHCDLPCSPANAI
jgi:hypothetical protein